MRQEDVIIENFFSECCRLYGQKGWAASAWASPQNQQVMFQCLTLVGDISEGTILDVGCGQGDFYDFIGREDGYTGIDICPAMVEHATSKHPDVSFIETNLLDYEEKHDWVVVGGSFNIRISESKEEQIAYLRKLVEHAYSLANEGMVFSVLSSSIPAERWDQLFYYKPAEILDMCLSLGRRVAMDHITLPSQAVFYMPKMS
jgi:SAM-dependent methyltransferase